MQDAWNRIVAWCERYAPEVLAGLNPGATDAQIAEAEAHLGVAFPDDLRELYRLHDGQNSDSPSPLPPGEWLSLMRLCGEWDAWEGLRRDGDFDGSESVPDAGIQSGWWNAGWIPLTYDGGGNHYCADLHPTDAGTVGQIITMWHDEGSRNLVAPSLTAWLEQVADGLESGALVYSPETYAHIVDRDDVNDAEERWRGIGDGT